MKTKLTDQELLDKLRNDDWYFGLKVSAASKEYGVSTARINRLIDENPDLMKKLHFRARRTAEERQKKAAQPAEPKRKKMFMFANCTCHAKDHDTAEQRGLSPSQHSETCPVKAMYAGIK
jgi:hypothetical protein